MKRLRDLTAVLGMVALTACNNASIEGSWVEPVPGMSGETPEKTLFTAL